MPKPKKAFQVVQRVAKDTKHPRKIFYVAFRQPDGSLDSPKSSGQTSRSAAETWAIERIKQGNIPVSKARPGNSREELIAFLTDFWDYDKSKYVRGKLARGGTISRTYCRIMRYTVNKFVKPTFEGRRIRTLTAEDFDDWMADLADEDVSAGTINRARTGISVALNHLVAQRRLPWNPLTAVKPYREVDVGELPRGVHVGPAQSAYLAHAHSAEAAEADGDVTRSSAARSPTPCSAASPATTPRR